MLLSRCAPRGAYDLGVLLKKWTQSSVLVLGSETAFLLYYRCDWDSVLWLVVLWQRNHDSQLPLTQRVLTYQGRALTLVLICPCRPHRLLRDKDHPNHKQHYGKVKIIDGINSYFLSVTIYLANSSRWSLHLSHFQWLVYFSRCQNVMASSQYLRISTFIGLMTRSQTSLPDCGSEKSYLENKKRKYASILVRITDLSIPVILIQMSPGKLSVCSSLYYHIPHIMKMLKWKLYS